MRRGFIGTIVAIFGVAAALGVGYSAVAKPGSRHHAQKLAKALKKCRKDKPRSKRKNCQKTAKAKYKSKTETGGRKGMGAGTGMTTGTTKGTGAGTPEPSDSGTLKIVYHVESFPALSYSLSCNPTSGTVIEPVAACEEISRNPSMRGLPPPYGDHSCPSGEPSVKVSGEYDQQDVKVSFSPCAYGDEGQPLWEKFLPTESQLNAVTPDRAIGPFTLGEEESTLNALLGEPSGTAGGLDVYKAGDEFDRACEGPAISGQTLMAIRYDSAGKAVTIAANTGELTLGQEERKGEKVGRRISDPGWCHGEKGEEGVPRTKEPLKGWIPVTCGGEEAFADHPLREASTSEDLTIVVLRTGFRSWS